MIANTIQTGIYNFLIESHDVQTADLFMLDSMCDLTYFENVQEHLLSLIPISQFKTEWILENEEFRKKCISKFPIEDVREEWFLDDGEKEIFKKRVKDEKKIKTTCVR